MEDEQELKQLDKLSKNVTDFMGKNASEYGGFSQIEQAKKEAKQIQLLAESRFALKNSLRYSPDNRYLPRRDEQLTVVDGLSGRQLQELENIITRTTNEHRVEPIKLGFGEHGMGYDETTRQINMSGDSLVQDRQGRLFFIGNGITGKRDINGKEYAVIESVLNPIEIFLHHELGHALNKDARENNNEFPVKNRKSNPFGDVGKDGNEELMNVSGFSRVTENQNRAKFSLPLRYGYISTQKFYQGKRMYESTRTMSHVAQTIRELELPFGSRGKHTLASDYGLKVLSDIVAYLPEDNRPVNPERLLDEYMKFSALVNIRDEVNRMKEFGFGEF